MNFYNGFSFAAWIICVGLSPARVPAQSGSTSTSDASKAIGSAIGAVLQADGPAALKILTAIPENELSKKDEIFRACALRRLQGPNSEPSDCTSAPESGDPSVDTVLSLYRRYWQTAAMAPNGRDTAEANLRAHLAELLGRKDLTTMTQVEDELARRLDGLKLHALFGETGLLRDAMVWRTTEDRVEQVVLPSGGNTTHVFYMKDFLSSGWSSYLTCGRTGTGGFAKPEGLYVITSAYESLSDENFKVSFLGHETQHYSDYRQFPGLKSWELEYRAKLVELIYADTTRQKLLTSFMNNQSEDPNEAHSYANRRLLESLRLRLQVSTDEQMLSVPGPAMQQAASAELKADTDTRKRMVK